MGKRDPFAAVLRRHMQLLPCEVYEMNIEAKIPKRVLTLSLSAGLALLASAPGWCDRLITTTAAETKVGGDPFNIKANAAGMTADERAVIIQKNLDRALETTKNLSPDAVGTAVINRNPVVLFDGKLIATADGNSAARLNLTQTELADEWARALQKFVTNYKVEKERRLTFENTNMKTANFTREDIAVLPRDMMLPVALKSSIFPLKAGCGDQIEAFLTTDVPIGPTFKTYLPKGTLLLGELVPAKDYMPNKFGGGDALTPHFFTIRTQDGRDIPIDGHILGDLNQFKSISTLPTKATCCESAAPAVTTVINRNNDLLTVENKVETATSGEVQGAWRQNANWYTGWKGYPNHYMDLGYSGLPSYRSNNLSYNGLIIPKHTRRIVPEGVPMMLQLATTTSVAVASNAGVAM
jgi:hypothetical protein